MTTNSNSNPQRRGATVAGLGGLALASVLLLCGAGNAPLEKFTPQGAMQADLNAGGHNVTNAATVNATNVATASLSATSATVGSLNATNLAVSGAFTATNLSIPFSGITSAPTTIGGYGITDAYTKTAGDARYSPLAGSASLTTLGAVTSGSFPFANLSGSPLTVAAGKSLGVSNSLTLSGTDGSTLNIGAGGTLGSAAFTAAGAYLTTGAIGTTVQGYNASTTTLGNTVNAPNGLLQADGNGLIVDAVLKAGAKMIYVSKSLGSDTRTGLSKYSLITPFATLTAAAGAASAGDTIVAEDGIFTDKNLTLVTGVNWHFMPGATITITGAANNDVIFKDGGAAATVVIDGCGQVFTIATSTASTALTAVSVTAASNLTVFGLSFTVSDAPSGGTGTALSVAGGGSVITMTGNLSATGDPPVPVTVSTSPRLAAAR